MARKERDERHNGGERGGSMRARHLKLLQCEQVRCEENELHIFIPATGKNAVRGRVTASVNE